MGFTYWNGGRIPGTIEGLYLGPAPTNGTPPDAESATVRLTGNATGLLIEAPPDIAAPTITFPNGQVFATLTTAITPNSTAATTALGYPAGSLAITLHATGVGYLFVSDGTYWQLFTQALTSGTIGGALSVGTTLGVTGLSTLATLAVTSTSTFTGAAAFNGTAAFNAALTALLQANAGITGINGASILMSKRTRVTVAQMNAGGYTLLPAVTGKGYRITRAEIIAIGGNAAATANATGVAIYGTQTTSQALLTVVLAGLTRSTINSMTGTNSTVLADGASFVKCDNTTAITCAAVGGNDLITATNFDVILSYVIE